MLRLTAWSCDLLFALFGGGLERRQGSVPEPVEVRAQRAHPVRVELVDAAGSQLAVADETRLLEDLQMLGDRRPADRQLGRQLADGAWPLTDPLEDRPTRGVAESREAVRLRTVSCHLR